MLKKVVVAVAAAMACASVAQAAGNEWEVHGYGRLGGQWDGHFNNRMSTLGKQDYRTVTSNDENNNQLEVTISKKNKVKGDVTSNFVVRAEYGNQNAGGNSAFYSSQGSEHSGVASGQFEVKEAYIEMAGFDYLGKETKIWTGQRFLNRSQALLSKEFWKQSSGVGFGFENGKFGAAMVSADQGNTSDNHWIDSQGGWLPVDQVEKDTKHTLTTFDFWYSGLEVPGGNLQFDVKYTKQANLDQDNVALKNGTTGKYVKGADTGMGLAVTYNTNWYGLKGWTQNIIAYGTGLNSNRGVNTGSWNGGVSEFKDQIRNAGFSDAGFGKDSSTWFLSTYGVADLTDTIQLATEITSWMPKNVGWNGDLTASRTIFAVQPSIKLNSFTRVILTGSFGLEQLKQNDGGNVPDWFAHDGTNTSSKQTGKYVAAEAAVAFTLNSDYFGRPQIKPFVSYVKSNKGYAQNIGITKASLENTDQFSWGVEGEIWF